MECVICKTDISQPLQQFGDPANPICQSDFLKGEDWVLDDAEILGYLKFGMSLDDAMQLSHKEHVSDLQAFAEAFFVEILKG